MTWQPRQVNLDIWSSNNGTLSCFDIHLGKALIDAERIDALQGVYASPVGASGRVNLTGRNGVTVVIKQSDKLEQLATNQLSAGANIFIASRRSNRVMRIGVICICTSSHQRKSKQTQTRYSYEKKCAVRRPDLGGRLVNRGRFRPKR